MAAVTLAGMLSAEATALAAGWTEERLLDLAGQRLGRMLGRFFPHSGTLIGYLGKGHNAGDALVAMSVLRDEFGWKVAARTAFQIEHCAPLMRRKWRDLGLAGPLVQPPAWRDLEGPLVLLDGLLGSGTNGPLREPLLGLAAEMAWLRQQAGARVVAVDLPSGLDADSGMDSFGSVVADLTCMIGNAKIGLLAGHAAAATGALAVVPVEILTAAGPGEIELIAPQTLACAKSRRPFDFHKGMAGRVGLVVGSIHYPGAAVLAATGALRGGAGLITLYVPQQAATVIAAKCPPEVIIRGYATLRELRDLQHDALVVGCGLGAVEPATADELIDLIANSAVATVIDADALNIIAQAGKLGILTDRQVLTPHPGEFQRLAPDLAGLSRELAAHTFVDRCPATLLLKGSRTIVTQHGQPLWCNATGNPGMATGGQGDLLAGVIGARLASGDTPLEAAALAAWLCGRGAELAVNQPGCAETSLTPSDVARQLGGALSDWQTSRR